MAFYNDRREPCEACTNAGNRCKKLGSWDGKLGRFICLWHWKSLYEHGNKLVFWKKKRF